MKASYRWLKSLLPGLEASPREVAERLTGAGLEVEAILPFGEASEQVVVARVEGVRPHPKREKLRLVTVERGRGPEEVVCGAPNVPEAGGLVVYAPLGTRLPAAGLVLEAREIGGVKSEGMLCSEAELGLASPKKAEGEGDPGILVLSPGAEPGTSLAVALPGSSDSILEIGVTPNRPDALGHVGLARELAALFGLPFSPFAEPAPLAAIEAEDEPFGISIEDLSRCPEYGGALLEGVVVGPSPAWLRYRLESLGVRPISNVVDLTNLLMLEFGHPTHAFDFDLLEGGRIVVRRAKPGERLRTLDGEARELDPDDLVIADAAGPVALAGVMGGERSEIRPSTRRVLLECAYFSPRGVRRASRRHGLHTESSHRFERGVDPSGVARVLARGKAWLGELASARPLREGRAGSPPPPAAPIRLRASRLDALTGAPVPFGEARQILERLGCGVELEGGEGAAAFVVPPHHRPDLRREVDLVEEVVRVRGLDAIPTSLPALVPQRPRTSGAASARARRAAIELGLSEAVTYGFVSKRALEAVFAPAPSVTIKNPLSEDQRVMRTSLLPGLLSSLGRARRHGVEDVRLFTLGARFLAGKGPSGLPDEASSFAAVLAGFRRAPLEKPAPLDVYDAKGVALELAARVVRAEARAVPTPGAEAPRHLHPRGAARVEVAGVTVGTFGPLHPDAAAAFDLDTTCFVVELDLRALEAAGVRTPRYVNVPSLPAATRDIALVVHDDVPAGAVVEAIREAAGSLCESVEVFDLFRSEKLPPEHRSLAFHVVYRDPLASSDPARARTLTDEEVDRRHQAVVESVRARYGAVLRA